MRRMATLPDPSLDISTLLELDPASFAAALEGQPESVKATVREALMQRLHALDTAAWGSNRKLRGYKQTFDNAKTDYTRIEQTQQWLAAQFHRAFEAIYADPAEAAAAAWAYEQEHGAAQTGRILKSNPQLFGKLRGTSLFGFTNKTRQEALRTAQTFDFAAYRMVFNFASAAGQSLLGTLQETARVANA